MTIWLESANNITHRNVDDLNSIAQNLDSRFAAIIPECDPSRMCSNISKIIINHKQKKVRLKEKQEQEEI